MDLERTIRAGSEVKKNMFDFYPEKLWCRDEVMRSPCPVPAVSGVYFWWFENIPSCVPLDSCITLDGYTLLYVGISPDKKGKPNSRANLRTRIKMHYSGNAEGSTLRRTLGVLLSTESNYPLRRVGSGKRTTLLIQVSSGLMSGWETTQRFTGYHIVNHGFWKSIGYLTSRFR